MHFGFKSLLRLDLPSLTKDCRLAKLPLEGSEKERECPAQSPWLTQGSPGPGWLMDTRGDDSLQLAQGHEAPLIDPTLLPLC